MWDAGYNRSSDLDHQTISMNGVNIMAQMGCSGVECRLGRTVASGRPGSTISRLPGYRRVRLGIGLVPQQREIFPSLTVEENLLVAERANGKGDWSLDTVYAFFPSLAERRRNRGNQLFGGEQQMLAIGRALMGNPSVLLVSLLPQCEADSAM
jgi:branched-chain amino acid transport system ATP-binding protein